MTNSNVAIGNRNGVTVDETSAGFSYGDKEIIITDLPGVRTFKQMTSEEEVTYTRINEERDANLLIVVDPTEIFEQVYFLTEMFELYSDRCFLVVFGMADETEKSGSKIYPEKFEAVSGVGCVSASARKGIGISELMKKICEGGFSFPFRKIKAEKILECFDIKERKTKIETVLDKIFLNEFFGLVFFCLLMFLVVYISFDLFGTILSPIGNKIHDMISLNSENDFATKCIIPILECIFSLIPRIFLLSVIVSVLDDCGYLARVSYLFSEKLKLLGIDGRVIVAVIIGFGCTVPAIFSLRTLQNSKERVRCIIAMPLVSCSARIPIMLWLSSSVGGTIHGIVWVILIYLIGIVSFLIFLLALRIANADFHVANEKIKLPRLRIPYFGGIIKRELRNSLFFTRRIAIGIFSVTVIMWFFGNKTTSLCDQAAFLFAPLGFDDGRAVSALVSGLGGKEIIVSSLASLEMNFSSDGALAFAVFSSLYLPCLSSIVTMHRELCREKKLSPQSDVKPFLYLAFSLFFMFAFAYMISYIARTLFLFWMS